MPVVKILTIAIALVMLSCKNQNDTESKRVITKQKKQQNRKNRSISKNIFTIRDIDNRSTRIILGKEKVVFRKIIQPIVIVNIFSSWCPPCKGMLPYLSKLQRKYKSDIFIIGILVHSDLNDRSLKKFMLKHQATFFISNHKDNDKLARSLMPKKYPENYPIPLTLIYNYGKLSYDIKGAIPYEMMETIIEQLKKDR